MISKLLQQLRTLPIEAIIWAAGLILLALYDPASSTHVSICPLNNLGFDFCPGCGLGRSVSFLFRGEIVKSLQAHPLGMLAVIVLSLRIFNLTKLYIKSHGKNY